MLLSPPSLPRRPPEFLSILHFCSALWLELWQLSEWSPMGWLCWLSSETQKCEGRRWICCCSIWSVARKSDKEREIRTQNSKMGDCEIYLCNNWNGLILSLRDECVLSVLFYESINYSIILGICWFALSAGIHSVLGLNDCPRRRGMALSRMFLSDCAIYEQLSAGRLYLYLCCNMRRKVFKKQLLFIIFLGNLLNPIDFLASPGFGVKLAMSTEIWLRSARGWARSPAGLYVLSLDLWPLCIQCMLLLGAPPPASFS